LQLTKFATLFLSYNIQFVCEYYRIEKLYAFNAAASSYRRASFLQLVFTALHGMQTRSSDENSVRLSVHLSHA